MALPTSVSFSPWKQGEATEETPLLPVPTRPTAATSREVAHKASTPKQLSTHAALTLHHLTDIQEVKDASASEDSPSPAALVTEIATPIQKEPPNSRGGEGLSLRVAVAADNTLSSLCTVTDTHRSPHASIVTSRVVSAGTRMSSLGQCCGASVTPALQLMGSAQALSEAGVSSRKSSLEERLSRIWSTSTESNGDCEGENCDGPDLRCRKCGKIVAVSKAEESNALAEVSQVLKGVISQYTSKNESFRPGMQQQPQVTSSPADGQRHQYVKPPAKQRNSHNYSALLSACSRNMKKKGNRRQSVDVIYAREPTEPDIEKIKAKRRLSRQTDVSSIELMTLNESNEHDDATEKGPSSCEATDNVSTLQVQGENIRLSHCQLSPKGTRIHNLRASSSTESCPRAPWNSLETNLSTSQDVEEKYIINDTRSQTTIPQTFSLEPRSSIDPGEPDTDHEGEGTDQEERASEEEPEVTTAGGSRRKRSSVRSLQDGPPARRDWPEQVPMVWQDWSAEAVVLVALLVYIACKVLRFMESAIPNRSVNKK